MKKGLLTTFLLALLALSLSAQEDDIITFPILDFDLYDSIYQRPTLQTPHFLSRDWSGDLCFLPADYDRSTELTPEYIKKWLTKLGYYTSLQIGYARKLEIHGDTSIVVAVIDDGINFDEEWYDLGGKEWVNDQEIPGNDQDDDGNGLVDDVYGYDFGVDTADRNSLVNNAGGHGTLMARTIGATDNDDCFEEDTPSCSQSMVGIMDSLQLMNLKVTDQNGIIQPEAIAKALHYAADNGAQVINISISLDPEYPLCPNEEMTNSELEIEYNSELNEALHYAWSKGCLIVVGNGNRNIGDGNYVANSRKSHYGQLANHPAVIAVGGVKSHFLMSDYNIARNGYNVDVVTLSQYLGGAGSGRQGTSYSSAIVAGMAGLLLSTDMGLKNYELKEIILEAAFDTVNTIIPLDGKEYYYYHDSINNYPEINDHTGVRIIADTLGYDSYYGWGFVRWPEIYHRRKGRDLFVDPQTGAVNDYERPTHFALEDLAYDSIFCYKEPVDPLAVELNTIKAYPNPACDWINISGYTNPAYLIVDMTGKTLQSGQIENERIDLTGLSKGIYLIQIDQQLIRIKKL